jgi:hypothetical protein
MDADRVMFEIYREAYAQQYRVVYFTELDDHNKDLEIDRAMAGEHVYDGFFRADHREEAKAVIEAALQRLKDGEEFKAEELDDLLAEVA